MDRTNRVFERSLDREPQEMPHNNEGYDMVSRDPEEFAL